MQTCRLIALSLAILACCYASSYVMAQEASQEGAGQLSRAVDKDDLDAYWLDQNTWMEYGYRPHVKAQTTPFANLPTYGTTTGGYSFGTDLPTPSLKDPFDKTSVQLTKYGTWH